MKNLRIRMYWSDEDDEDDMLYGDYDTVGIEYDED